MTKAHTDEALVLHEGSVHSADDARIGFHRLGEGPALVFVHGSVATHTDWLPVAKILARQYTCILIDRRGRGRSSFGPAEYSMATECEDIATVLGAVQAKIGTAAALIGHSYGATCCLEAALHLKDTHLAIPRLAVYEPVLSIAAPIAGAYLGPYCEAVASNDLDRAVQIGMEHFIRYNAEEIAALRSSRAWKRLHALAPSWGRELRVMDELDPSVERFRQLDCPVLLIRGSESPEHPMLRTARELAAVLPHVQAEVLHGQNHMGMRLEPGAVAAMIDGFVRSA
jgi:pimeloyl-ACP methyl ester carboxylesterase